MAGLRRRIASTIIVALMAASLSGCMNKPYKDAYYRADNFAKAVKDMDYSRITKYSSGLDNHDDAELKNLCDLHSASIFEDYDTVANSMTYEIDVDTLETNNNKSTVNVIFSMLDWNEDDLEDAKIVDVVVTLNMKLTSGKWVVTNAEDIVSAVYEFSELTNNRGIPGIDGTWWYCDQGTSVGAFTNPTYTNYSMIDFDLNTDSLDSTENVYYTVAFNNEVVYTSRNGAVEGYYNSNYGAEISEYNHLRPGIYTITFYDGNSLLISDSCTVIEDVND